MEVKVVIHCVHVQLELVIMDMVLEEVLKTRVGSRHIFDLQVILGQLRRRLCMVNVLRSIGGFLKSYKYRKRNKECLLSNLCMLIDIIIDNIDNNINMFN